MGRYVNKILAGVAIFMALTVFAALIFFLFEKIKTNETFGEGFSFSPVGYDSVGKYREELAPVMIYDRWGYCDNQGKVMIVPRFAKADEFSSGLASVQETDSGMYGYIDTSGKFIIEPQFSYAGRFSEEHAASGSKSATQLGYIDKSGEFVIPEKYYEAGIFSEGLAKVRTTSDGLYSFIDKDDNVVIPANYTGASDFSQGLAAVLVDGKWGYIDKTGKMVIEPLFTQARAFHEDLAAVELNDSWGYIDKNGIFVIMNTFSDADDFSGGYAPVKFSDNGLWGYITSEGKTVVRGIYKQATGFSDGVAALSENSKWIFVTDNNYMLVAKEQANTIDIADSSAEPMIVSGIESETTGGIVTETISNDNVTNLVQQIQLHVNDSVKLTGNIKTSKVMEKLILNVVGEDGEDKGIYLSIKPNLDTYNLDQVSIDGRIEPFNMAGKYKLQLLAKLEDAEDEMMIGEVNVEVLEAEGTGNLLVDIGMIESSAYPVVIVFMSVFDNEMNSVSDLSIDNFILYEAVEGQEETQQKIELLNQPSVDEGLNVALVFDSSKSMYNDDGTEANSNMEFAKNAAINFIDSGGFGTEDKVSIQSFGKTFKVEQDFTASTKKLVKAINGIKPQPDTSIFDSIIKSVNTLSDQQGKKCIIIFTDGDDTSSKRKYVDSIESALEKGIPVYSIAIGEEAKTNELKSISDKTGGAFYYLKDTTALNDIYKDITDKLKNQYQLTYTSTAGTTADKSTKIKLVVASGDNSVEAEKTYELK